MQQAASITYDNKTRDTKFTRDLGQHYIPPSTHQEDGHVVAHAVQTIRQTPEFLFNLWSQVELIPRWQEYVVSVSSVSPGLSHWVIGDPSEAEGKRIEFDSEITQSIPSEILAWRSISENVHLVGSVTFKPVERGTRVVLLQEARIPGGILGNGLLGVARRSPTQLVKENLRHFKQIAEAGEIPTVVGQPAGPRGITGSIKHWMYGENNPTPPGTSSDASAA